MFYNFFIFKLTVLTKKTPKTNRKLFFQNEKIFDLVLRYLVPNKFLNFNFQTLITRVFFDSKTYNLEFFRYFFSCLLKIYVFFCAINASSC